MSKAFYRCFVITGARTSFFLLFFDIWDVLSVSGSVVFHIELDSTKFDDVSAIELVIEIILSRLGISHHNKHLVVDVFIRNGVTFAVQWSLCNQGVVFYLEVARLLPYDDHWFGCFINVFWFGSDRDKLNVVINSEYLTSRLSFDVFLGYVL